MNHTLILTSIVLQSIFAVLGWLAWDAGLLLQAWENDTTYITPAMLVVFGVGYSFVLLDTLRGTLRNVAVYEFVAYSLVTLGLIGTVFGFQIALSGVNPETVGDVSAVGPMVANLLTGMRVAIWTTLSGLTGYLVISTNLTLMERCCASES